MCQNFPVSCVGLGRGLGSRFMRLLDRYLLRELLVPLGYCLGGFLIFWISFDLLTELSGFQEQNLTAADVTSSVISSTQRVRKVADAAGDTLRESHL